MTQSKQKKPFPQQSLDNWLNSINLLLSEVSAIEISTMIVDEITEEVFIPYEVYQAIYAISPESLAELGIAEKLRDRYLRLRRQLELQYALLLTNKESFLYNQKLAAEVQADLPMLAQETTSWESLPCRLPPPVSNSQNKEYKLLSQLLVEPSFRSVLRQLGNIKQDLDRRNLQLTNNSVKHNSAIISGVTYAQTVIQLDGKIINRYAAEIIQHPQQEAILKLHQQGVEAGENQWHKLLHFLTKIIRQQS